MQRFTEKMGLEEHLNDLSCRDGNKVKLSFQSSIKLVTTGIIAGAKSLTGVLSVWSDKLLADLCGLNSIPDDSTLGRSFKRQNKQTIADFESLPSKIEESVKKIFISSSIMRMSSRQEEIVDIDGSPFVTYGFQEGAVKGYNHTKRSANCYQTLLAFDSLSKTVKLAWLQAGNTHCGNGIIQFCKQLYSFNPHQRKFFRLDSGFFSGELFDEFDKQGNGYLAKVKLTNNLKHIFQELSWKKVEGKHGKLGWEQSVFEHACTGWKRKRTFSVVRIKVDEIVEKNSIFQDHVIDQFAYFCYVSTKEMTPWSLHNFYGQRATCENLIDQLKNQMNLGKIRSNNFDATTLLFHCAVLAYNLVRWMTICSSNKKLISWEISTIRNFLIRIAAKIKNKKQLIIEVSSQLLYQEEVDIWLQFCS